MTWNQSMCMPCWVARHGDRIPARLRDPEHERCCLCGADTTSGIYVRLNPTTVPYPRQDPT